MDSQYKNILKTEINSLTIENIKYLESLKNSLLEILLTLKQENENIKELHSQQVDRLNIIIKQKQQEIHKLKQLQIDRMQALPKKSITNTPYKILLKNKSNQCLLNKQLTKKQQLVHCQEQFQVLNNIMQNRLSLQIGSNGRDSEKKSCRVSSSNIKNKIIKRNNKICDRLGPKQNQYENNEILGNYSNQYNSQYLRQNISKQNLISPRCITSRYAQEDHSKYSNYDDKLNSQLGNNKSLQIKSKLTRKPSNKTKRFLFQKKMQPIIMQTGKYKCLDLKVPIKIINVSSIKPR